MSDEYTGPVRPSNGDSLYVLVRKAVQLLFNAGLVGGSSGVTRTAALSTVNASGSVAAGKKYIEFILSPDFAGTIGGSAFTGAADSFYSLPLLPGVDTYDALNYTVSAGSARLTTIE